jgi:hypothetical protein
MPKAKKSKKVTVQATSKKPAKVEPKPSWQDAGILMKKGTTAVEQKNQQMIIALSVAFDIPPQGITILADNPYINKQGLEFVFDRHRENKGWSHFISEPVELAKQAGDTAVFVTRVYDKNDKVIANGYGSANAANIKMGTIKAFLNEMAETRSQNRCLRKVVSPILYQTFIDRVNTLQNDQRELITEAAANFGSVTAEEVGASEEEQKPEKLLSGEEMKAIAGILQNIANTKAQDDLEKIGEEIKAQVKSKKLSKNQIAVLREAWAGKYQKLAFEK